MSTNGDGAIHSIPTGKARHVTDGLVWWRGLGLLKLAQPCFRFRNDDFRKFFGVVTRPPNGTGEPGKFRLYLGAQRSALTGVSAHGLPRLSPLSGGFLQRFFQLAIYGQHFLPSVSGEPALVETENLGSPPLCGLPGIQSYKY